MGIVEWGLLNEMKLKTGCLVASGRYVVEAQKCEMGGETQLRYYSARDIVLDRQVLLLVGPVDVNDAMVAEARAAARLGPHPNIASYYDTGSHEGYPYLVQEAVTGENLASAERLTTETIAAVARGLCAALAHAHAAGVAHGNLDARCAWLDAQVGAKVSGFAVIDAPAEAVRSDLRALGALLGRMQDGNASSRSDAGLEPADAPDELEAVAHGLLAQEIPSADEALRRLLNRTPVPVTEHYVGRGEERAALQAALEESCSGSGRVMLLAGEPGIGKTRVAEELAADAERQGVRILWGMSLEGENTPSYWPWVEALRGCDPDSAEVVSFLTDPEHVSAGSDMFSESPHSFRFAQFDAVASFLSTASKSRPILVVLDDLHCADEASLQLLAFVVRRLDKTRVLIVGTYRDTELKRGHPLQTVLADLARARSFGRLTLRGLAREEIARFMEHVAGGPVEERLLQAVYRQTEGNPLFTKELVRLLSTEGALTDPHSLTRRGLEIPEGVKEVIGMGLDRLSEPANRLLALASVIGVGFSGEELAALAADGTAADVPAALEEALRAGVLVDARRVGSYRFHHSLIREVLYDELTSIRRAHLHLRLAQALEQLHQDDIAPHIPRLAEHYLAASPAAGGRKALEYAKLAGLAAMRILAFEDAVRHFRNALDSMELIETTELRERLELHLLLAEAQTKRHDLAVGWRTLRQAFDIAIREGMLDLCARAALLAEYTLFWCGVPNLQVIPMLERTLERSGDDMGPLRARVLASLARALLYDQRPAEAELYSRQAVHAAQDFDDPSTHYAALEIRLIVGWGSATSEERLAWATEVLEVARRTGDPWQNFYALGRLFTIHMERGERAHYLRCLQDFAPIVADPRQSFMRWPARLHLICLLLLEGRYEEALERAQSALELGRRNALDPVEGTYGLHMFTITRNRGQLATVRPLLERFVKESGSSAWEPGLALLYAELDMAAEAREVFERLATDGFAAVPRDHMRPGALAYLAEVCAYLQDEEGAAAIHQLLLPYAHGAVFVGGIVVCLGSGSRFLGLLSSVRRQWAEAEVHFQEALAFNEKLGARPALTRTRHDFAAMLLRRRRGDDVARASQLAEQALDDARQIGMASLVRQLETLAQAAAAHRGKRAEYPNGLSARELEVLRLIAEGASNQEIAGELSISEKTVHNHVSNVLNKTGCANRAEAASFAIRKHLA